MMERTRRHRNHQPRAPSARSLIQRSRVSPPSCRRATTKSGPLKLQSMIVRVRTAKFARTLTRRLRLRSRRTTRHIQRVVSRLRNSMPLTVRRSRVTQSRVRPLMVLVPTPGSGTKASRQISTSIMDRAYRRVQAATPAEKTS